MAKKMANKLVGDKDQAQANVREFLFIGNNDDARNIRFEYDSMPAPSTSEGQDDNKTSSNELPPAGNNNRTPAIAEVAPAPAPAPAPTPIAQPLPPSGSQEVVADVDITPTDIILSIVAQKLRRGIERVPVNDSIRTLSAGEFKPLIMFTTSSYSFGGVIK